MCRDSTITPRLLGPPPGSLSLSCDLLCCFLAAHRSIIYSIAGARVVRGTPEEEQGERHRRLHLGQRCQPPAGTATLVAWRCVACRGAVASETIARDGGLVLLLVVTSARGVWRVCLNSAWCFDARLLREQDLTVSVSCSSLSPAYHAFFGDV